ncbi:MAG: hypothetical protein QXD73_04420 [Candidatus Bathyarchaeia archaeon]
MGGIQNKTLTRFFAAFKDSSESLLLNAKTGELTSEEIREKSGLNRSTVFRVLRYGVEKGFIGKTGSRKKAKYYLKLNLPKTEPRALSLWEIGLLKFWLKQNEDKIEKYGGEVPGWFMEIREALLAFDADQLRILHTDALVRLDALRQLKREINLIDDHAVKHALHPTPLDENTLAWKEREDRRILKQIRKRQVNVFP